MLRQERTNHHIPHLNLHLIRLRGRALTPPSRQPLYHLHVKSRSVLRDSYAFDDGLRILANLIELSGRTGKELRNGLGVLD